MKKISILALLLIVVLTSCKKANLAGDEVTGEGLNGFSLKGPASGTNLILNAATPTKTVEITWTAAKPGLYAQPTYTWLAALKTSGTFDSPLLSFPADNSGKDIKLTVTYKQIDDALKAKGIADGAKTDLIWSVKADNGSVQVMPDGNYNLSITRFKDGASPFILLAPTSATASVAIDPGSTTQNFTFRWTKSLPPAGGPAIGYKVLFSLDGNFASPLFTLNAAAAPADTTVTITYKAFSDSLNAHGQTNLSQPTNLKWTVVATSGTWKQQADYVNDLSVLREVRMYMPGSFQKAAGYGPGDWDPTTAPELIRDLRPGLANNMYYIYIFLPAGTEFKVTQGRSWDVNYGGTGGNLVNGSPNNLSVATAGVYRVSVNRTTLKYDISAGRMGFVGNATAADWNPPAVFPLTAMGFGGTNVFVGIQTLNPGGWKLIDNNQWNNGSNSVDETRSYGATTPGGTTLEVNGANFTDITAATAGRYRVIWDGRDVNNLKYEMSPAAEMRIVGNGMVGVADWTPGVSPQMTYIGNGKWQKTLQLAGGKEIKFLAGNDWGAFDYEDSGDNGTAGTSIKRKIKWDGSDNFKTPAVTGTYTVTLDENTQTVTIAP